MDEYGGVHKIRDTILLWMGELLRKNEGLVLSVRFLCFGLAQDETSFVFKWINLRKGVRES
jgi:hypothetical protein